MAVDAAEHSALATDLGWLLRTAERDHTTLVNDALGSLPGRVRGYRILIIAAASAEHQNHISQRLGIDRTVMTSLLDDLETAELVRRVPDATDRRAHLIMITGRGRSVVGRLTEQVTDADHQFLGALERQNRFSSRRCCAAWPPLIRRSGWSGRWAAEVTAIECPLPN